MTSEVLVACAVGLGGTLLLAVLALFNLDEVTPNALSYDAFRLAAAAFFMIACVFRFTNLRPAPDRHLAGTAGALGVLALLAMPFGNLLAQVVGGRAEPALGLAAQTAGSLLSLALLGRVVVGGGERGTAARSLPAVPMLVGVALAAGAVAAAAAGTWAAGEGGTVLRVAGHLSLAVAWLALGLLATEHDRDVAWARRLSPLLVSLGVVELLRGLEHVRPDQHRWGLAAVALLASLAMLAMHAAFVDLVESTRATARAASTTSVPARRRVPATREALHEVEVAGVVSEVADQHRSMGLEVRLRGGAGTAVARTGDLVAALDAVLLNAARHAAGSPVTVHVVAIADRVEVSVSDRGPGLGPSLADEVFGDTARARGRGLAVARQLLQRNGGELALRSRIGGATFVLSLPAAGAECAGQPVDERERVQRRSDQMSTAHA